MLFPVDLDAPFTSTTYVVPAELSPLSGGSAHLITGLTPDGGYDVTEQAAGGAVRVTVSPGTMFRADSGGVLLLGRLGKPT